MEEDTSDVNELKAENKQIRHEIFDLHDTLKELQDKLAEIKEDSLWDWLCERWQILDLWQLQRGQKNDPIHTH